MRKTLSVLFYEYKIQMSRLATWGILLAVTVITLLDAFPSGSNLARIEFLPQPAYFLFRIFSQNGLILIFGLMFLLSSRFAADGKSGVKSLFMAAPISKGQYVFGKLIGNYLYALSIIILFLFLNSVVYALFNPENLSAAEYIVPLFQTVVFSAVPASLFISFCAVALPAIIDIRLFYFVFSALFVLNAAVVGSADSMPFYLITSGNLIKLVWQHPKFPFNDLSGILTNLFFLLGCGLVSSILVLLKPTFWRAEE